jgi:hypothetical protein
VAIVNDKRSVITGLELRHHARIVPASPGSRAKPRDNKKMGMTVMVDIRLLVDSHNHLGEGPLWDVEEQRLYWIDSSAAEIWSCTADGADVKLYYVPSHIGSMALREKGCSHSPMASACMTSRRSD